VAPAVGCWRRRRSAASMGRMNRGGGGWQPGQGQMSTEKAKKFQARAEKAARRAAKDADGAGRCGRASGRGGKGCRGGRSGRGMGPSGSGPSADREHADAESVHMSQHDQQYVHQLLTDLRVVDDEGMTQEKLTDGPPQQQVGLPHDISIEDVDVKASAMLTKKGFSSLRVGEAMAATAQQFRQEAKPLSFNECKRQRYSVALQWLCLHTPPEEVPVEFSSAASSTNKHFVAKQTGRPRRTTDAVQTPPVARARPTQGREPQVLTREEQCIRQQEAILAHYQQRKQHQQMGEGSKSSPTREGATLTTVRTPPGFPEASCASERQQLNRSVQASVAPPPGFRNLRERQGYPKSLLQQHRSQSIGGSREQKSLRLEQESKRLRDAWSERLACDDKLIAMRQQRQRLPAWPMAQAVCDCVREHQVVVVVGETGCGKTTQLPQFVLEECILAGEGAHTNIICTQPRRISATSVAQRVAQERVEEIGESIGYQIRLEARRGTRTRMLFCTTGVLLRRLIGDPWLDGVSHVFVDEVHERSLDSDILLVLLKDLIGKRRDLRVVLMSATLNAKGFSDYFNGAPMLEIPGFTHPVKEHHLEDIVEAMRYELPAGSEYARKASGASAGSKGQGLTATQRKAKLKAAAAEDARLCALRSLQSTQSQSNSRKSQRHRVVYSSLCIQTIQAMDLEAINYELLELLLTHISLHEEAGAILVFLPGLMEIKKVYENALANPILSSATGGGDWLIPLHSALSSTEQGRAFSKPPQDNVTTTVGQVGMRKIVLATNIAETSVTIDDVVHVVDCGRAKETAYDAERRLAVLEEQWVSAASAKQRRGRAGRVRPGHCWRLYPAAFVQARFDSYQVPEMLRVPLTGLILQLKLLKVEGGPRAFLKRALQPPGDDAVEAAVSELLDLGALEIQQDQVESETAESRLKRNRKEKLTGNRPDVEDLTALGKHLAVLPVDVRVGKMLVYGAILGCLEPVLTIAAVLGSRSPFVSPLDQRDEADAAKKAFAKEQSDLLAAVRVVDEWEQLGRHPAESDIGGIGEVPTRNNGRHRTRGRLASQRREFCQQNFLSWRALDAIADLKEQFRVILYDSGFSTRRGRGVRGNPQAEIGYESVNAKNTRVVKAVLCCALYPNVVRVEKQPTMDAPPKLLTRSHDGKEVSVQIHPCSVNYDAKSFDSIWLLYHEKVQTTALFLRDTTTVTPYALLLFGNGELRIDPSLGSVRMDWLAFRAPVKVAVLLKEMRTHLNRVLAERVDTPTAPMSETHSKIIGAIVQLLTSEKL